MNNIHKTLSNAAKQYKSRIRSIVMFNGLDNSTPSVHNAEENFVNHIDPYAKDRVASQMQRVNGKWTVVML